MQTLAAQLGQDANPDPDLSSILCFLLSPWSEIAINSEGLLSG